jgi:hypothetical protein
MSVCSTAAPEQKQRIVLTSIDGFRPLLIPLATANRNDPDRSR